MLLDLLSYVWQCWHQEIPFDQFDCCVLKRTASFYTGYDLETDAYFAQEMLQY